MNVSVRAVVVACWLSWCATESSAQVPFKAGDCSTEPTVI